MKLTELLKKYYFHDSSLESFQLDEQSKTLVMEITFCNWMQDDYVDEMEETSNVNLTFCGVSALQCVNVQPRLKSSDEILEATLIQNEQGETGIKFLLYNWDFPDDIALCVFAESVEFIVIGPNK